MADSIAETLNAHPFDLMYSDFSAEHLSKPEYSLLQGTPLTKICARFCIIRSFNQAVRKCLHHIDLNPIRNGTLQPDTDSMAMDPTAALAMPVGWLLSQARSLVFRRVKVDMLRTSLTLTKSSPRKNQYLEYQWVKINIDRTKARTAQSPASTVYGQLVSQARGLSLSDLRHQEAGPLDEGQSRTFKVDFVGEKGADNGGPYREVFNDIAREMQSDDLPLLVACPNQSFGGALLNQDKWLINSGHQKMEDYRWLGRLIGVALRCQLTLDLNFPALLWAPLVRKPLSLKDCEAVDFTVSTLIAIRKHLAEGTLDEALLQSLLMQFRPSASSIPSDLAKELESATVATVGECLRKAEKMWLKDATQHYKAIRYGLSQVIPTDLLVLMTPQEFGNLVCGTPDFTLNELKRLTVHEGDCASSPPPSYVCYFWEVLGEMSPMERRMFLNFVWARSRMPHQTHEQFKLAALPVPDGQDPDERLPTASTCFFRLMIPPYTSKKALRSKLFYAMENCLNMDLV